MFSPSPVPWAFHSSYGPFPLATMASADFSWTFSTSSDLPWQDGYPCIYRCPIYCFGASSLAEGLDFAVLCHLIRPHGLSIGVLFVSTDTAAWLTLLHAPRQTSLPLAWLRDVAPALKGLPVGTVIVLTYIHLSWHTQGGAIAGGSANLKVITLNKHIGKPTVKCLEIPHYS